MKFKVLVLSILFFSFACSNFNKVSQSPRTPGSVVGEVTEITSEVLDKVEAAGEKKILKFSVLKDSAGKFSRLLIQDPRYQFHHEFLSTLPEFKNLTQKQIEAVTYKKSADRKAYIGVLSIEYSWFADMDRPATTGFYLMSEELPEISFLSFVRDQLNKKVNVEQSAAHTDNFIAQPHQEIEALTKTALFKKFNLNLKFEKQSFKQAYADGWAIGLLKMIPTQADLDKAILQNEINKDVILVLGEAVRDLPPCAGVISAVPLTPGSHLSLLAQMYGIPLVYQKEALKSYASFVGKEVFLSSNLEIKDSFQFLSPLTQDESNILKSSQKKASLRFDFDPSVSQIVEVKSLQTADVKAYGGKATQFGYIRRQIPENTVDAAAGIPLWYFLEFSRRAQVDKISVQDFIKQQLASLPQNASYAEVDQVSRSIQDAFKKATLEPLFFSGIKNSLIQVLNLSKQASKTDPVRLKLRSSSNVEDGAEFNGAGLYDSEGVCLLNCKKDDFEKGLRKVWGSLYTTRGLWARRYFKVDENRVGMGLLAHAPFKEELFNGVIRFSSLQFSETVTQRGEEESVTNAQGESSAEVTTLSDEGLNVQTPYKGLPVGRTLMSSEHYKKLHELMKNLMKSWSRQSDNIEIEAEWKLMKVEGQEKIFIKQVREVPRQNRLSLPDGSEKFWLTGGKLHLKGTSNVIYDTLLGLYRVRDLKLELKSFTENQMKAGKIQFGAAEVTYKDKVIQLQPSLVKATLKDNVWTMTLSFTNSEMTPFSLEFQLAKTRDSVVTPKSEAFQISYSTQILALKDYTESEIRGSQLMSEADYMNHYETENTKPQMFEFKTKKPCTILVTAQSDLTLKRSDQRRFYFNEMIVSGVLPAKKIKISKVSDSFHQMQIHEWVNRITIDLFADSQLTQTEKDMIDKKGRYMTLSLSDYKKTNVESYKASVFFTKNNLLEGAPPKGCVDDDSGSQGDEE